MPRRLWDVMVLGYMHGDAVTRPNIRQHLSIEYSRACTNILQWYDHQATTAACHRVLVILSQEQNFKSDHLASNEHTRVSQAPIAPSLETGMVRCLKEHQTVAESTSSDTQTNAMMWLFWLQLAFLRNWNGDARIRVRSVAGVALRLLCQLCKC